VSHLNESRTMRAQGTKRLQAVAAEKWHPINPLDSELNKGLFLFLWSHGAAADNQNRQVPRQE
jgi:hypothetical protein